MGNNFCFGFDLERNSKITFFIFLFFILEGSLLPSPCSFFSPYQVRIMQKCILIINNMETARRKPVGHKTRS